MAPKLNRRRALLVLSKIDEILAWEAGPWPGTRRPLRRSGPLSLRSACRAVLAAGQPEVLRRVPGEEVPGIAAQGLLPDGHPRASAADSAKPTCDRWDGPRPRELAKVARRERQEFDCAPWLHKAQELPREEFKREVEKHLTGKETEAVGDPLFQGLQEPVAGDRAGARDGRADAGDRQVAEAIAWR